MADFTYHVIDAATGAVLQGAEINDVINTSPCPYNSFLGQSATNGANGCTSGAGFTVTGNTDSNGNYSSDTQYSCPMTHTVTASAPGYYATTVNAQTGDITGDAAVPDGGIQLTPLPNVAQNNQGVGATTSAAGATAQANESSFASTLTTIGADAEKDLTLLIIGGIVVAVIIAIVLVAGA